MNTIIHLSDFHIKASDPNPSNNQVFTSMVESLKKQNFKNIILVYTGDVIDSKSITIKGKAISKKKAQWKSQAQKAFSLATEYFKYLTKELHVSNDHIIMAVGNHDVNQFDDEQITFDCPIDDINTIQLGKDRFELISRFYSDLNYQFSCTENHIRTIDSFNFIVANTQWVDKYNTITKGLCTNCFLLNRVFEDNKKTLLNTKQRFNKLHNIFVAHNPERDCCEFACFDYPENNNINLEKKVRQYCGIKLFGDKHTKSSYKYDYIVGAPLDSDYITYGIHKFTDNGMYSHETLNYVKKEGKWVYKQEPASIKEILKYSQDYLMADAYDYLKIEHDDIDLIVPKIYDFNTVKMSDAWNNLEELFTSFISLQQPVDNQPGRAIDLSKGLFNCITDLLRYSTREICLTIRGNSGTGKSVFLSALYLNLLYEFSVDLLPCIPFYINIDKIIDNQIKGITESSSGVIDCFCIDNEEFFGRVKNEVRQIFEGIESLTSYKSKKALLIIDGAKQFNYYENFKIEDYIDLLLGEYKNRNAIKTSVICLDADKSLNLGVTLFHRKKDSEYIAYFDSLYSYNVQSQNKLQRFIKAYCLLNDFDINSSDIILNNIERLQIPQVDLDLMTIAGKKLCFPKCEPIFNILYIHYSQFIASSAGSQESGYNLAAHASYLLHFENCNYSAIKRSLPQNKKNAIGYRIFKKITENSYLARILIAIHYCNQLSKKTGSLNAYSKKVLNRLYGYDLCLFILGYLKFRGFEMMIRSFEDTYYKNLDYSGKSTLTYLIGRIIGNRDDLRTILKKEEKILRNVENVDFHTKRYYEYRIAMRSIHISRMAKNIEDFLASGKYFDLLLSDSFERRINRKFYMQFYGDRSNSQIEPNDDVILNGLDFYYTFQMLATRLSKWSQEGKRSKLLELELFTLCDLVQLHLDCPNVTHKYSNHDIIPFSVEEKSPASFFYNDRYTDPARNKAQSVLSFMNEMIEQYLSKGESAAKYTRFKQYLHVRKDQITNALDSIEKKAEIDTFNITSVFDDLSKLAKIKKTGWHISDSGNRIDDEKINEILQNGECFETTLEHVYECLLIGLLYLPDKVLNNNENGIEFYNKNTIMKMLLIHDLGEAYIGDYPPSYVSYAKTKEEEDKACVRIFLSGTHAGMANMTEYLNLWNGWYSEQNYNKDAGINVRIAMEIDKIQMIYKMFKLLLYKRIQLSPNRIADFYDSKGAISTTIGRNIFNNLIANNSSFQEIAKEKHIDLRNI